MFMILQKMCWLIKVCLRLHPDLSRCEDASNKWLPKFCTHISRNPPKRISGLYTVANFIMLNRGAAYYFIIISLKQVNEMINETRHGQLGKSSNAKIERNSEMLPTDGPTNTARCRVVCPRLKIDECLTNNWE